MSTKFKTIILTLLTFLSLAASATVAFTVPKEGVVTAVIDGDTVVLQTGGKVRYLGVDSPEIGHDAEPADCYGGAAKKTNEKMVLGRRVVLKYGQSETDSHGRLLAYVFLQDGTCVNLELLRSGNAFVYRTSEDFQLPAQFMEVQREAIKKRRGLWGACTTRPEAVYFGNRRTFVLHREECDLGRDMSKHNRRRFSERWSAFSEGFRPCRICKP